MSLAQLAVPLRDFDFIYDHLVAYKPPYRNMHMRDSRQRRGKRQLRYLHALHAPPAARLRIDGMISGPGIFVQYSITRTPTRTQWSVAEEIGPEAELERIERRFFNEVINRVEQERSGEVHFPKRIAGQFYLRRSRFGSAVTDPRCQRALAEAALDERFLKQLNPWQFQLLCP